jgi:hypothetical protein
VKSFSQAYRPVRDSDHAAEIYKQLQSTPTGVAQTAQKSAEKLATDAANTLKSSVTNSAKQSATVLENSVSKALKDATGIDLKALQANPADTLSRLGRDKIDGFCTLPHTWSQSRWYVALLLHESLRIELADRCHASESQSGPARYLAARAPGFLIPPQLFRKVTLIFLI